MDIVQSKKRDMALLWFVGTFIAAVITLATLEKMLAIADDGIVFLGVKYCAWAGELFFWFKMFYHWSKAKGYPAFFALLGCLAFPLGPLALALMKDRMGVPPPLNDPLKTCTVCGSTYRLGDYNSDAQHIYCSKCGAELRRDAA